MRRLFFLFIFLSSFSFAQTTTVSGTAPFFKNSEIALYTYDDYITYREKKLTSSTVKNDGTFEIKTDLNKVIKAIIRVDDYNAHIYLEPGKIYKIFIPKPLENEPATPGNTTFIPLNFDSVPKSDINHKIIEFNKKYDRFLKDNYALIVQKKIKRPLDVFKNRVKRDYPNIADPFFKNYVEYSLATLDQLTFCGITALNSRYLNNKPVLYDHPEYMYFFNQVFDDYLWSYFLSRSHSNATDIINKAKNYEGALAKLKSPELLANDTLRELVLLKGLSELYYHKDFDKKSIVYMLKQAATKSTIAESRKIASNILYTLTHLEKGAKASSFSLTNTEGKKVSLDDFKGKYVYLSFWATWCVPCLQDFKIMEALHKKYGNQIAFISVSLDKNPSTANAYLKKNSYPWHFLHYGTDKDIKSDYDVRSVPQYFLIDPDGEFHVFPTPPPAEVEKVFYEIGKKQ